MSPDSATIEEMAIAQQDRLVSAQRKQEQRSGSRRTFQCDIRGPSNEDTDTDTPPEGVNGTITITTYVHVIHQTNGLGVLSNAEINKNVRATNELLLSSGFQLKVASIKRVVNNVWYTAEWNSVEQNFMHSELKQGGLNTLNVYYKAAVLGGVRYCGYANLADNAKGLGSGDALVMDTNCVTEKTVLAHEVGTSIYC